MSQTEEFVKVVEAAKEAKGVIFVTGKPGLCRLPFTDQ